MSHTPGGRIFKRYLNAIRPVGGTINPPLGGFLLFEGYTAAPGGTVTGDAETVRDEFLSYLSVTSPETYEDPPWENGFPLDSLPTTSNGNTATVTATTMPVIAVNNAGRFNTTPAGFQFAELSSVTDPTWTFSANMAGFGFFMTDAGDFDAVWTVRVTDENAVVTDYEINAGAEPNGNLRFWGFLDNSGLGYVSVQIFCTPDLSGDAVSVDDVYIVSPAQIVI